MVNDIGASLRGDGASGDPAAAVVAEIEAAGSEAVAAIASVAEPLPAASIVETALHAFGRVDFVVNNAGIIRDALFHKMSVHDFEAVVKVHLLGAFYLSHAAARHFREQGSRRLRPHDLDFGAHRPGRPGQLHRGQARCRRPLEGHRARHGALRRALQLRFAVRLEPLTSSLPTDTPEQRARVERFKQMTPAKIAPLVTFLGSDAAKDVTGQIFAARNNEIFLMGQSRPLRSIHRGEGWTTEAIADHAIPALRGSFAPLEVSGDVFNWDPV